jgi:hypothetical protein
MLFSTLTLFDDFSRAPPKTQRAGTACHFEILQTIKESQSLEEAQFTALLLYSQPFCLLPLIRLKVLQRAKQL